MDMKVSFLMCKPLVEDETSYLGERAHHLKIDKHLILQEWEKVYTFLQSQPDVKVEVISAQRGLPDMLFAASAAFIEKRTALLSSFRQPRRIPENAFFRDWLKRKDYKVIQLAPYSNFEGSRSLLKTPTMLFGAFPSRLDKSTGEDLEKIFSRKVLSLQLTKYPYLDQSLSFFSSTALVDESSLDETSLGIIKDWVSQMILVASEEREFLPSQAFIWNQSALIPKQCPKFQEALEAEGFSVYALELPELLKLGAGPKGLVLEL